MQEKEIIHALQNGQAQVFEQVVELHKNKIYNTVLSFLQNETDAEDITQEVFVKAYQQIHQFRGDATLATWLYRIAVTQSIDFLRRKKRRNPAHAISRFFGSAHINEEVPDFHHPGVAAEQKETAAILFKAINQLPSQQAAAFLLQKTEQLSQYQIASILQMTEGAVESLLYRAKTNLQKLLKDYYQKHYA